MKTQDHSVSYIIVHIIPLPTWAGLSYLAKKAWHYQVSVTGKSVALKPVDPVSSSVEVVFVGSERYAHDSAALFSLLLDLWMKYPEARIEYAHELQNSGMSQVMVTATRWLMQHMPRWLQRRWPKYSNLFTLRAMLPLI
jgi:hypothetical protein